jgi:20S proteasome subunit beta 10
VKAITAGILGDLGSGGAVDACVITATGAKLLRTLSSPTEPMERWEQGRGSTMGEDGAAAGDADRKLQE